MSTLDHADVSKTLIYLKVGEAGLVTFEFSGELPTGRTISGAPTVAEVGSRTTDSNDDFAASSDLTITNVNGTGSQVQALVAGALADTEYKVLATATDSGTPAQTLARAGRIRGQV